VERRIRRKEKGEKKREKSKGSKAKGKRSMIERVVCPLKIRGDN
jgi:hypothetical protein